MEFDYKIIEKDQYLFISLKGKITRESKVKINTCLQDCGGYPVKTIVLILKDMLSVDQSMNRDFAMLQHELRNRNKILFLVGIKSQLKDDLNERGLIRTHELRNKLEDLFEIAA